MRHTTQRNSYRRENRYYGAFVEGNVARKPERNQRIPHNDPRKKVIENTQKDTDSTIGMNLGYMLFLVMAMVFSAMIIISSIRIQSEITLCVGSIANLESELNTLKITNDEEYNRAVSSVDLEEVRNIAIGELGMRYAKEGQIINVSGEGSDYVRQLAEIGE